MASIPEFNNNGLWGFFLTFFLYVLSFITVSELAAIAAILAGFSTFAYNLHKFWLLRKRKKELKNK